MSLIIWKAVGFPKVLSQFLSRHRTSGPGLLPLKNLPHSSLLVPSEGPPQCYVLAVASALSNSTPRFVAIPYGASVSAGVVLASLRG